MTPLDLTLAPPRSPRASLRGLCMLPRMIDVARAKLPGGNIGEYQIGQGFSGMVLGKLRLDVTAFVQIVAEAADDASVAVRAMGDRPDSDFANLSARLPLVTAEEVPPDLREAFERYYGKDSPAGTKVFDLLESDDRAAFPAADAHA